MKKFAFAALAALFVVCLVDVTGAGAQQMSEEHKAQMEKLGQILGEWTAEGAYVEEERGRTEFDLNMEADLIVQGWAVEIVIKADIAEIGLFAEKDFLAYDPMEKSISLMTVTNFGEVAKYTGKWDKEKENVLRLAGTRMSGEKKFTADVSITFVDDDTFEWEAITRLDGKQISRFWARFTK